MWCIVLWLIYMVVLVFRERDVGGDDGGRIMYHYVEGGRKF